MSIAAAEEALDPLPTSSIASDDVWQLKSDSCAALRAFEAQRSTQIDKFQVRDRAYWRQFHDEIRHGDALKQTRTIFEATGPAEINGVNETDQMNMPSSISKALHVLGEVQTQMADKIVQLTTVVKREVMTKPLEEMATTYKERVETMVTEGNKLDAMLYHSQKNVVDAFEKYEEIFNESESRREGTSSADPVRRQDLWLAEMNYCIHVQKQQQCRVEYVTGMAALFQQYKAMELWRASVIQTALDTYIPAAQRIDPERDLVQSIRRIPKNYTAASLSASDNTDARLFSTLRSPISSPLLVRCGFLKNQVSGSLFASWKDVLCAITHDGYLHLLDLKESTTRSITKSTEAMLGAIATNDQTADVYCQSVRLTNCRIEILALCCASTLFGR
ncbi:uncharacterized protein PHALS_13479 [Plasmopara halstedii]|uniref:Uncharacterized protein n=1 Tax=Plasmopara halstedii TaxID=4781 RepID=A0A0N7L648_PLAHL|nr:uncharacterized protein PHALS_13479 [Plasmopara halstedii]CEG43275.1 hypothetical protein PHALS_13479 [Plasmopara halstedii]|eukprot:XP_024579644.1 hypothetical protein PHALS_13479 [Plasmopara halstedii]